MDFTTHNTFITSILPSIESYQNSYIQSFPMYFQSLKTHSSIPTITTIPNLLNTKPSLKTTTWTATGLDINKAIPVSIEIHEYLTPSNNKGWQILFKTSDGIKEYVRSVGYGIESSSRTFNWQEIIKP